MFIFLRRSMVSLAFVPLGLKVVDAKSISTTVNHMPV